jgi:homoserine dehydrogenase
MKDDLNIGVAGLGTVGSGLVRLIQQQQELLARRCGRGLNITAVSARDRNKDRGVNLEDYTWYDDPVALATAEDVDLVVELIGGEEGAAKTLVETAIANGKHVVTANKALIALHGTALAEAAETAGVSLQYEAAVAGGIPIVKALREGLAGNDIQRVYGILNGTCNYILTTMEKTGREFSDVLAEAQALGYAEADPAFDIDGIDAAHKLAILTSLAFGCRVDFDSVHVEGIRQISATDIRFAADLGYRIKLLAIARPTPHGVEQRVHPCLVDIDTPIAHVDGVFNAVVAEGDFVDQTVYEGRGAGDGPTASAVVADIVDIARDFRLPPFGTPVAQLVPLRPSPMERHVGCYYIRMSVLDQPGVIADVTAILRDGEISIETMLQRGRSPGEAVPVVLITHETEEAAMNKALAEISDLPVVQEPPTMIRMEQL